MPYVRPGHVLIEQSERSARGIASFEIARRTLQFRFSHAIKLGVSENLVSFRFFSAVAAIDARQIRGVAAGFIKVRVGSYP